MQECGRPVQPQSSLTFLCIQLSTLDRPERSAPGPGPAQLVGGSIAPHAPARRKIRYSTN